MKKMGIALFVFLGLSTSCQDLIVEKKVINDYYLVAADSYEQLALSKRVDGGYVAVIQPTIYEFAEYKGYIILKQHPRINFHTRTDSTCFYVFNLQAYSPFNFRPLDSSTYRKLLVELQIDENKVDFDEF